MNGLLDEVTIYNRGLDDAELRSIFQAGSAGKCKPPRITTLVLTSAQLGESYEQTLRAEFGTPPYIWSVAGGSLPSRIALSTLGILSGTPQEPGTFTFVASLVDAGGAVAVTSFSLDVLLVSALSNIRITKVGNIPVPGRTIDYFIVVENVGSTTALNIPVLEAIAPVSFLLVSADPAPDGSLEDFVAASVIGWTIPSIAPGDFRILTYRALVRPSLSLGTHVVGGPACVDKGVHDTLECVTATLIGLTPISPCHIVESCSPLLPAPTRPPGPPPAQPTSSNLLPPTNCSPLNTARTCPPPPPTPYPGAS